MRSHRRWWIVFAACAAAVVLAMGWVTVHMLRLEQAEVDARGNAEYQNELRVALWQMDSWLVPVLAREAGRPFEDYQPFLPPRRVYTKLLSEIEPGEVLTPSPLLAFRSLYTRVHFQVDPQGIVTSPQVPTGSMRELAEVSFLGADDVARCETRLTELTRRLRPVNLFMCVLQAETPVEPDTVKPEPQQQEYNQRWQSVVQRAAEPTPAVSHDVGLLVPVWLPADDANAGPELIFVRRAKREGEWYYQGFSCDWVAVAATLTTEVADVFPDATLTPAMGKTTAPVLASIPLALETTASGPSTSTLWSPTRITLALSWLGVLAGLVAAAVTLGASIRFGESRSRFASAVTHELRSPLTTFRMYSEMLAKDMVPDAETRQSYLDTLRVESDRLSRLVENVLAYARIERGHDQVPLTQHTVGQLLEDATPELERRAIDAGMTLAVERNGVADRVVTADDETVRQILGNLVDNACKYACEATDKTIHVSAHEQRDLVELAVHDHGPGIGRGDAVRIFEAFERGGRGAEDPAPGVGLGLALARSLARRLGGELRLDGAGDGGARFVLSLPANK